MSVGEQGAGAIKRGRFGMVSALPSRPAGRRPAGAWIARLLPFAELAA
jgi:hypothetical protein